MGHEIEISSPSDLTPSEPDDGMTAEERIEKIEWQKNMIARYRKK